MIGAFMFVKGKTCFRGNSYRLNFTYTITNNARQRKCHPERSEAEIQDRDAQVEMIISATRRTGRNDHKCHTSNR